MQCTNESFKGNGRIKTMKSVVKTITLFVCLTILSGCLGNNSNNESSILGLLQPMEKSSIKIEYNLVNEEKLPIGASKIGGDPDLPSDFEWLYYYGESYRGVFDNYPLSFLAQINCKEISQYDKDSQLPSEGMLYFFYELETMTWGFSPEDKGSAKVYYYPGDVSDLRRTELPSDLLEENRFPEMSITFSTEKEFPDFEEFIEWHGIFDYEQYDEYNTEKSKLVPMVEEDSSITKLLGYANLIQGGVLLECELTSSGVYTGGEGFSVSEKQIEDALQWQLLFQLDTIITDNYSMYWGDSGRIYFYIKTEDLKAQNFDDVWLILQCY